MRTRILDYFYEVFKIQIPFEITADVILKLENLLSGLTDDTSIIVGKEDGRYCYVVEQRDPIEPDNYCHWIGPVGCTREDALLGLFIRYSYIDDVFYDVRKIFNLKKQVPNDNNVENYMIVDKKLEELSNEI